MQNGLEKFSVAKGSHNFLPKILLFYCKTDSIAADIVTKV
jgi:hypothetical protein